MGAGALADRTAPESDQRCLVQTELDAGAFPDDAPWTPAELAPDLVRRLATGRYDALAGRYLQAEHDNIDELLDRMDEILDSDLNAIRLRRQPESAQASRDRLTRSDSATMLQRCPSDSFAKKTRLTSVCVAKRACQRRRG